VRTLRWGAAGVRTANVSEVFHLALTTWAGFGPVRARSCGVLPVVFAGGAAKRVQVVTVPSTATIYD
jgi:hypothetical protein